MQVKYLIFSITSIILLTACDSKTKQDNKQDTVQEKSSASDTIKIDPETSQVKQSKNSIDFVPQGFTIYKEEGVSEIRGDLNKDGLEDVVLIIKATDKSKIIQDETRGEMDKNRRGIIILFNKGNHYEVALENRDCFSSENEDGGVYYPPELYPTIEKGNLIINYSHGRYGYWSYTFRFQKGDFELIGYDRSSNRGPVPQTETSINFLTQKKLTRDNLNKDDNGDDYVENFKDTWETINTKDLLKLSEIKDFDQLTYRMSN